MAMFALYASTTGVLAGFLSIQGHPAEISKILVANTPAGSSTLAIPANHPAIQNADGWAVVGGAFHAVTPTAAALLIAAQTAKSAAIETSYQNATFVSGIAYMGTTFWTDQNSQNLLVGAMVGFQMAGAVPVGFAWWDATGKPVSMTLAQLQGLYQAIVAQVNTNFVHRKALLAQIAAATTVAEVQAVGW